LIATHVVSDYASHSPSVKRHDLNSARGGQRPPRVVDEKDREDLFTVPKPPNNLEVAVPAATELAYYLHVAPSIFRMGATHNTVSVRQYYWLILHDYIPGLRQVCHRGILGVSFIP